MSTVEPHHGEPVRKKQKTLDTFLGKETLDRILEKKGDRSEERDGALPKWSRIEENGLNVSQAVVFDAQESKRLFLQLENEVEYLTGSLAQVKVFGKVHNIPRQHSAYGDDGLKYKYSGVTVLAKPWTPALKHLKEIVEKHSGFKYNFVLVNRYRDGKDKMGDHRDDEKELCKKTPIASFSLGAERDFILKHIDRKENKLDPVKILLRSGTLLLMFAPTNDLWVHGIPARAACKHPRINLTFRCILPT